MVKCDWYIVQVLSGHEKKFIDTLRQKIEGNPKKEFFEDFFVPEEEKVVVRRGKKVSEKSKIFPGYVLVKMHLNDDSWSLVRSIPRVTGMLGDGQRPVALSNAEVERIYKRIEDRVQHNATSAQFEVGDNVQIIDGPFDSFTGVVQGVDVKKKMLSATVSIFGRQTPLELRFDQVTKV